MFLNKSRNGFTWYAHIKSTDQGGNELQHYLNFRFKKGCEPKAQDLNAHGSYEGELIFHDANGRQRKVFPVVNEYNGLKSIEFILMDDGSKPVDLGFTQDDVGSIFGQENTDVQPEDLPFY